MMSVAIINLGSGNLGSAANAFKRMACELGIEARIKLTADVADVAAADRIVLPGVGAFADFMGSLGAVRGMCETLEREVRGAGKPFLGICVGMQLMAERSHERGIHPGLGWIAGDVVPITPDDPTMRIPHMGWNDLSIFKHHPLLDGIEDGDHAYFVHSYQLNCASSEDVIAEVDYGGSICAVAGHDNMVGTQFHPERSRPAGLRMIANFLRWRV